MILENLLILEFLNEFQSGMQGPLSAGPCVRVAGHGMKKISTGMTLLFKLRALFKLCILSSEHFLCLMLG